MLDQSIIEQLKSVFQPIQNAVELVYAKSSHEKQSELLEMLEQVAGTSEQISVSSSNTHSDAPSFEVRNAQYPNGIRFTGIPGGHEFTSLILAILNSDHQGKLPDDGFIQRIQRLKGPIRLRTFVSLSCENCPEVVQALNLMSIFHADFQHEMVDGAFAQEEVSSLGIQGVPSVMDGETLVSSGKSDLAELLAKLEEHFGVDESIQQEPVDLGLYDVAIIGGGPAGASAAIYSARKGLKTIVLAERMGGQVKDTKGIENLISVPYVEGPQLTDQLVKHMAEYDIEVLEHRRVSLLQSPDQAPKHIELNSGEFLSAKSVIVTTGAKWRELNIPGEKEYLGRGVAFCPHCDGPYYKGKDIAVIGGGNSGVEAAIDLAGIVKSVTLFEFATTLKADQVLVDKLESLPNVNIITNAQTTEVLGDGGKVTALAYKDRDTDKMHEHALDGVFVQIGLVPNSGFLNGLLETNDYGEIIVDNKCRTNVPGIFAAGDVTTTPYKQIVVSLGEGAKAALSAFEEHMLAE